MPWSSQAAQQVMLIDATQQRKRLLQSAKLPSAPAFCLADSIPITRQIKSSLLMEPSSDEMMMTFERVMAETKILIEPSAPMPDCVDVERRVRYLITHTQDNLLTDFFL
jgi:hypothetical protein